MAQTSVFLGEGEKIRIEVHTDPEVRNLEISGTVQLPDNGKKDLTFQDNVALFTPDEEGAYKVEVTAKKENYRPSHLSATFHYRKNEPDISEFSLGTRIK
jgi:hypothetical protein